MASERTARVSIVGAPKRVGANWEFRVRVENLAGHKLPSGVGFRRAFLAVSVLGAGGEVRWASGRTDSLGVLVGEDRAPLACETATRSVDVEPHHEVIASPREVQIYEERTIDDRGALTTSFVGQFARVKDNRLLPRGWRSARDAPESAPLQPVAVGGDTDYSDGSNT